MKDNGYSPDKWRFDDKVTDAFDDMLKRSIPQYEVMRKAVADLVCSFEPRAVVDLGCARGEAIAKLLPLMPDIFYHGYDASEPMINAAIKRFEGLDNVFIEQWDLRERVPRHGAVYLCVLTLQFIPMEYRQRILKQIADAMKGWGPNCGLILVEKVLGNDAQTNDAMTDIYEQMKLDNGYTKEDVDRKKLALEGVLVPVTAKWNEELLRMAGFTHVDCFWRWMNFAGWVAYV